MKKTQKILIFWLILLIISAIFACFVAFMPKIEPRYKNFETKTFQTVSVQVEKTKPVITSLYENDLCEFVYDGTPYSLDFVNKISINSDQELKLFRIIENEETEVVNEFVEVGEYKIKITADETMTFLVPEPVYLTVCVLPRALVSDKSSGKIGKIEIIHDDGFCLGNSYSATDISKSQKRTIKKAVKNHLAYTEEIIEMIKIAPNIDGEKYSSMTLSMELPNNYATSNNYRIFEYTSSGELKELSYVINRGAFALSDVPTDSIIIVSANKPHPYLWIWILTASLSFVGMVLAIYFFAPRKLNFYLEGSKIYVIKLSRRQDFSLCDGLENYEWYCDPNFTIKANGFGVKERSRNFYAKITR